MQRSRLFISRSLGFYGEAFVGRLCKVCRNRPHSFDRRGSAAASRVHYFSKSFKRSSAS
jgi:hypothetical protein